jgi:hypothetical protein
MAEVAPRYDPKPQPPREPEVGECCQSGCEPCVYDRYWEALDHYERALREWSLRNGPSAQGPAES